MIKTYVIDTNVLIQAPYALECFEDNNLVLPLVVLKNWMDLKRQRAKKESMQEPQSESWNGTGRRVICYRE